MAAEEGGKDKQALFAEWALPHMDYIYTASLYLARNRTEAEDLFQETYLRAYRFFHQFVPGTNCRAWLLTILHNAFKNRYRQQQRTGQTVDLDVLTHEYEKKFANEREGEYATPETAFFAQLLDSEVAKRPITSATRRVTRQGKPRRLHLPVSIDDVNNDLIRIANPQNRIGCGPPNVLRTTPRGL